MGISPSDSLNLIDEYPEEDVGWFVEQVTKQFEIDKIVDELSFVNNSIVAFNASSRKGNISYRKWRRDNVDKIEELNTVQTVFDRLKKSKKIVTVFDKLRKFG